MKLLATIRDQDLGLSYPEPAAYEDRQAARAVVFDTDDKIALLYASNKFYHKLPGGGVEQGEDIKQALLRELIEEIGCRVENIVELGVIEEFRNKLFFHQLSYCYICNLVGEKGQNNLDQGEIADGFKPEWLPLEEAIAVLENESQVKDYRGKFIQKRDLIFLKEALKVSRNA